MRNSLTDITNPLIKDPGTQIIAQKLNGEENIEVESNCHNNKHIDVKEGFGVTVSLQGCEVLKTFMLFMGCFLGFFRSCLITTEPRTEAFYLRVWLVF